MKYPAHFNCNDTPSPCVFQLAYFLGNGFDPDRKQRRNILYIPGGPGALVDSESRTATLRLLEKNHNVVYFHPRGMGQSALDGSKEYDQFLRAGYVVEDIEKLRQAVLRSRPWDAIYAHSWGTVIAQRYAAKYGPAEGSGAQSAELDPLRSGGPAPERYSWGAHAHGHRKSQGDFSVLPLEGDG